MYCNEQFAKSLTDEQKTFLNESYNNMLDGAYSALLKYESLKTKSSLVEFMDLAGRAFQYSCLLDDEENELFRTVYLGYDRMLRELEKEEYGY